MSRSKLTGTARQEHLARREFIARRATTRYAEIDRETRTEIRTALRGTVEVWA